MATARRTRGVLRTALTNAHAAVVVAAPHRRRRLPSQRPGLPPPELVRLWRVRRAAAVQGHDGRRRRKPYLGAQARVGVGCAWGRTGARERRVMQGWGLGGVAPSLRGHGTSVGPACARNTPWERAERGTGAAGPGAGPRQRRRGPCIPPGLPNRSAHQRWGTWSRPARPHWRASQWCRRARLHKEGDKGGGGGLQVWLLGLPHALPRRWLAAANQTARSNAQDSGVCAREKRRAPARGLWQFRGRGGGEGAHR